VNSVVLEFPNYLVIFRGLWLRLQLPPTSTPSEIVDKCLTNGYKSTLRRVVNNFDTVLHTFLDRYGWNLVPSISMQFRWAFVSVRKPLQWNWGVNEVLSDLSEFQPGTCGSEAPSLRLLDVEQAVVVHIDTVQSGTWTYRNTLPASYVTISVCIWGRWCHRTANSAFCRQT
jgi:hypothetical protein